MGALSTPHDRNYDLQSLNEILYRHLKNQLEGITGFDPQNKDASELLLQFSGYNTGIDLEDLGKQFYDLFLLHPTTAIELSLPALLQKIEGINNTQARAIGLAYLLHLIESEILDKPQPGEGNALSQSISLRDLIQRQLEKV